MAASQLSRDFKLRGETLRGWKLGQNKAVFNGYRLGDQRDCVCSSYELPFIVKVKTLLLFTNCGQLKVCFRGYVRLL